MKTCIAAFCATAAIASLSVAHEFWIQPSSFRPAVGERVGMHLLVGDGFPGEPRPRDPTKLGKFMVVGPDGESAVPGKDGEDPAGIAVFSKAGTHVVTYRSLPTQVTLEAAKFDAYLKEEGLEHVSKARAAQGATGKPGRESYSRAAKSLVLVGGAPQDAGHARVIGFPAEITPTTNPYAAHAGDAITFRVTHDSASAEGVLVRAFCKADPKLRIETRTNSNGEATFTLDHQGTWLIGTVRMDSADGSKDADWVSTWASLTFDLAPAAPKIRPTEQGPGR
ncbi:MAG TPA: DUF4198 domain-containing protein [Phycisphaerales bacterium]|nr:DUF4198 domain-containing protein [Phycisphaerales bacterium]